MARSQRTLSGRFLGLVDDWWLAVAGVAFIVGSDFKYRVRPPGQALGGGIDAAIMVEMLLYGLVAGYLLLDRFRVPRVRRIPAPLYLAACFVGLAVLSLMYTPYLQYGVVRCVQATILLAVVVIAAMDGDRSHFHRFAHLYLLLILAGVGYGLVRPSPPLKASQAGRFTWLAVHPTVSGAMMCLAAVVAVGYVVGGRSDRPGPRWPPLLYWGSWRSSPVEDWRVTPGGPSSAGSAAPRSCWSRPVAGAPLSRSAWWGSSWSPGWRSWRATR